MANVSAAVANWVAVVRTVETSVDQHGDAIAQGARAKLFPDDGAGMELKPIVDAMGARLGADIESLRQRDIDLAAERADDAGSRKQRDDAVADGRLTVMRSRSVLEGAFSDDIVMAAGLSGQTPQDPDILAQYCDAAATSLRRLTLPPAFGGLTVDPAALADRLSASATAIRSSLTATKREEREAQAADTARDEAEAALRRDYVAIAGAISALATLAGLDDVADRVRPTARRRAGVPEPIDTAPADGPTDAGPAEPVVSDEPSPSEA